MKHLRLALEGDTPSAQTSMGELEEHIDALSQIGDSTDVEGGVSMESILRSSGDLAAMRMKDFKVAMEDFSAGVWAAIAAGIAALLVLIYKAIDYFLGSGTSGSSSGAVRKAATKHEEAKKDNAKAQEYAEQVEQILKDVEPELAPAMESYRDHRVAMESNGKKVRNLQDVINATPSLLSEYEQVTERHVEFLYGPMRENVFVKKLEANKGFETETYKAVELATRGFDEVTDYLLRDIDYGQANVERYHRLIEKAKQVTVLQVFRVGGRDTNVHDLAQEMQETHKESQTKKSGTHNSFMDVLGNLSSYFEHDIISQILKALEMNLRESKDATKKLEEAQALAKMTDREAKKYENDSEDPERQEYLKAVREGNRLYSKFISEYAGQLRGSIVIANLLVSFSNHLSNAQKEIDTLINKVVSEIMKHGKEVPDQLRQLAKNK